MNGSAESQWLEALKTKGPAWVKAQLQARPGRPDDILYDVVHQEPYPTRAFCQRWCAEQDNRLFQFSGHSRAVLVTVIVLLAFVARMVVSWNNIAPPPHPRYQGGGSGGGIAAAGGSGAGAAADGSGNTDPTSPITPSAAPSGQQNTSSLCGYITYQTDRCGRP